MADGDAILWTCRHCQETIRIRARLAGKAIVCPRCGKAGWVPTDEGRSSSGGSTALRPALCNLFRVLVWVGCLEEVFRLLPAYNRAWFNVPSAVQQTGVSADGIFWLVTTFLACFALDRLLHLAATMQPIRWRPRN